ncbi:hypothetical protein FRC19_004389, partial [Serendipita sp. 401]
RIVILVCYGMIIFLPFLCSFICLYLPETGTLRAFASAFHQEKRTNKFALFAFFILSNAWTGLVIYATEKQITENKVLPGEGQWGSGQILALLLCGIPLLGCVNIALTELGTHNPRARRYIKRTRLHRVFGIRFESGSATPSASATPRSGTPRRSMSGDAVEGKDLESGFKDGDDKRSLRSPSLKNPNMKHSADGSSYFPDIDKGERNSRRLSKRDRYQPKRPEDIVIVSPGEDSGPEDWPGSPRARPKRPRNSREATLVNPSERPSLGERRKSTNSIASQSVRSVSGSVKLIVHPDGRTNRVLSRRSSMAGESVKGRERDEEEERPRRRLSKSRPVSRGGSPSRSTKRSRSEDGYWSAAEEPETSNGRRGRYSQSDDRERAGYQDRETIRESRPRSDSDKNDDPLSKYYWDASRGWLERK